MKTGIEKRQADRRKLFQSIIKSIGVDKAIKTYGENEVRWAISKYIAGVREQAKLEKKRGLQPKLEYKKSPANSAYESREVK